MHAYTIAVQTANVNGHGAHDKCTQRFSLLAGLWGGRDIDWAHIVRACPYRLLRQGTVEMFVAAHIIFNYGTMFLKRKANGDSGA
eukprot:1153577-Pelagomonas_calceolata.AAC.2